MSGATNCYNFKSTDEIDNKAFVFQYLNEKKHLVEVCIVESDIDLAQKKILEIWPDFKWTQIRTMEVY